MLAATQGLLAPLDMCASVRKGATVSCLLRALTLPPSLPPPKVSLMFSVQQEPQQQQHQHNG